MSEDEENQECCNCEEDSTAPRGEQTGRLLFVRSLRIEMTNGLQPLKKTLDFSLIVRPQQLITRRGKLFAINA